MSSLGPKSGTGVHATCVVHGESGVLILGPSGSGKSALGLALMAHARQNRLFGALIGDDRVYLQSASGRLLARGPERMRGMIERRMAGLVNMPYEPRVVVRLAVELSPSGQTWPRLPDEPDLWKFGETDVPRLALDSARSAADHAIAVVERLEKVTASSHAGKRISLEHYDAVHKNDAVAASPPA